MVRTMAGRAMMMTQRVTNSPTLMTGLMISRYDHLTNGRSSYAPLTTHRISRNKGCSGKTCGVAYLVRTLVSIWKTSARVVVCVI